MAKYLTRSNVRKDSFDSHFRRRCVYAIKKGKAWPQVHEVAGHIAPVIRKTLGRKWGEAIKPQSLSSETHSFQQDSLLLKISQSPSQHHRLRTKCSDTWAYGDLSRANHSRSNPWEEKGLCFWSWEAYICLTRKPKTWRYSGGWVGLRKKGALGGKV